MANLETDGMEAWQSLGVALLIMPVIQKAIAEAERRKIPPDAFLVSFTDSEGIISFNQTVQVRCKLDSGVFELLHFSELWERYGEVQDVEPLLPCLAHILYVRTRLLVWDLRSVLPYFSRHPTILQKLGLLKLGPVNALNRRQATWSKMTEKEQHDVLRDTLTSEMFEPGRKRVPPKGIIVTGKMSNLDSGDDLEPFRVFRLFDSVLGRRTLEIPESKLPEHSRDLIENYEDPKPISTNTEDLIDHWTASLKGQEKVAVEHWFRAKLLDTEFDIYCQQRSLRYKTVHKAVRRGLKRLRGKSPRNFF